MYISRNNQSSRKSLLSHQSNQKLYSFHDRNRHQNNHAEKRMPEDAYSYPINYQTRTQSSQQRQETDNFNYGWTKQFSKIEEINNQIARSTEDFLQKSKFKVQVESPSHRLYKRPEDYNLKYKRQYVRFDSPRAYASTKHNYGSQHINIVSDNKDNESIEGKRSRKSSVKVNFLYELNGQVNDGLNAIQKPERDVTKISANQFNQRSSPTYNNYYHSTDLILSSNNHSNRKSSLKKEVRFIYGDSNQKIEQYDPVSKSTILTSNMAKYPSKEYIQKPQSKVSSNKYTNDDEFKGFGSQDPIEKDEFYDMGENKSKLSMLKAQSKSSIKVKVYQKLESQTRNQLTKVQTKKVSSVSLLSQIKDKEGRVVAMVLIVLAIVIFIMQLLS